MKSNIHPTWNHSATVTCSCGNVFNTGSSLDNLTVDICSACHPFFTGEMKFVDRQGRVDKFNKKLELAKANKAKQAKKTKKAEKTAEEAKSYKQILQDQKKNLKKEAVKTEEK